jgi:hypothetical protein
VDPFKTLLNRSARATETAKSSPSKALISLASLSIEKRPSKGWAGSSGPSLLKRKGDLIMYKIEKNYINDAGNVKVKFVVIDICSSKAIEDFETYLQAEAFIFTQITGGRYE